MVQVSLQLRDSSARCGYCRDEIAELASLWTCGGCAVSLHSMCTPELERCPTLGCGRGFPVRPRPDALAKEGESRERGGLFAVFSSALLLAFLLAVIRPGWVELMEATGLAGRSIEVAPLFLAAILWPCLSQAIVWLINGGPER